MRCLSFTSETEGDGDRVRDQTAGIGQAQSGVRGTCLPPGQDSLCTPSCSVRVVAGCEPPVSVGCVCEQLFLILASTCGKTPRPSEVTPGPGLLHISNRTSSQPQNRSFFLVRPSGECDGAEDPPGAAGQGSPPDHVCVRAGGRGWSQPGSAGCAAGGAGPWTAAGRARAARRGQHHGELRAQVLGRGGEGGAAGPPARTPPLLRKAPQPVAFTPQKYVSTRAATSTFLLDLSTGASLMPNYLSTDGGGEGFNLPRALTDTMTTIVERGEPGHGAHVPAA